MSDAQVAEMGEALPEMTLTGNPETNEELMKVLAETDQWLSAIKTRTGRSPSGRYWKAVTRTTLRQFWQEEKVTRVVIQGEAIRTSRSETMLWVDAENAWLEAKVKGEETDLVGWICNFMKARANLNFVCEVTEIEYTMIKGDLPSSSGQRGEEGSPLRN